MNWSQLLTFVLGCFCLAEASVGDKLPGYKACYQSCYVLAGCIPGTAPSNSVYDKSDFTNKLKVNSISRLVFSWDCKSDCHYKCQQYVTAFRMSEGHKMVKFHGKWPFIRVLGVTEFMSVIFSIGNFYANYHNLHKVRKYMTQNRDDILGCGVMARQYLALLAISCLGWAFSIIFHIRDLPITETLDYLGAGLMVMATFNVIFVRYFRLFAPERASARTIFHTVVAIVYFLHIAKLLSSWDYTYNMKFNIAIGMASLVLWVLHAINVGRLFLKDYHTYNSSIQLLPYENRILLKLTYLGVSKSKLIPYLPILLNLWMLLGVVFEIYDFRPVWQLVDAHSVWHLMTTLPVLLWYDWNLWDLELYKVANKNCA